ncbi:hypothetical protein AAJP47_00455 [Psychrobacter sp. B38]|uniref:hypothetical protein n=1 Tax=Psychrobacter sp. B38 TaxID=3143538 RepID=UPI00320FC979
MMDNKMIKSISIKIQLFRLPLVLVIATSPVQAQINTVTTLSDNSKYNQFVEKYGDDLDAEMYREFSLPDLSFDEVQLAESILDRVYNLYPIAFYNYAFDQDVAGITQQYTTYSQALNTGNLKDEEKTIAQCLTYTNQPLRYKRFAQYFAYEYVDDHSIEEVQDGIAMLNHFFIDDLAMASQTGDTNDLDSDFNYKLKQQGLEDAYEDFLNSADYKEIKELTNLEVGKRSGEPVMPLFIYANYMTCGYLTKGIMNERIN